jgi:hypothetical protein
VKEESNMRSLRYSAALLGLLTVLVFCARSVEARTIYPNHGDRFTWNSLCVFNNQWGRQYANPGWYQRIVKEDNNTVSWEYKWWGRTDKVKGYPTIMAGWHYGDPGGWMTPKGSKNLPSKISDQKAYATSFNASHTNIILGAETMNLSWDVWLASTNSPTAPKYEIMVWPWRKNQLPIGSKVGTVAMWNANWDLYRGNTSSGATTWEVFTFIRTSSTLNTGGNLRDFINYVSQTKGWISSSTWIVGIEFGAELIQGNGSFNIRSYSLN